MKQQTSLIINIRLKHIETHEKSFRVTKNKLDWKQLQRFLRDEIMISVWVDVSKEKSTVCIMNPYGEIISKPFEVTHTEKDLSELASMLLRLEDEVRVSMEVASICQYLCI